MEDKSICHIMGWKEAGKFPEWASIAHPHPTTKAYWAQWDSFAVKEGVLNHRWELPELGKVTWQLVLPKGLGTSVLKQLHDNHVGGHIGVSKTLPKVRERLYCIHCRCDVEEWRQRSDLCAVRKGPKVMISVAVLQCWGGHGGMLQLMSWNVCQKSIKVTSTFSLR